MSSLNKIHWQANIRDPGLRYDVEVSDHYSKICGLLPWATSVPSWSLATISLSVIINDWPKQRALAIAGADFLKASKVAIAPDRDAICGAALSRVHPRCKTTMSIVGCIDDKLKHLQCIQIRCIWSSADKWWPEQICSKLVAIYVHFFWKWTQEKFYFFFQSPYLRDKKTK